MTIDISDDNINPVFKGTLFLFSSFIDHPP